jgi:hypothetical protein
VLEAPRQLEKSEENNEATIPLGVAEAGWTDLVALETPRARKLTMLAKWSTLPTSTTTTTVGLELVKTTGDTVAEPAPSHTVCLSAASRRMMPEPPAEAVLNVIGSTQHQRSAALLHAAGTGDVLRLRAALIGGCDVEATDECGQTAAFIAAWRGNVGALQLLRWAGANLNAQEVKSQGGITIQSAAQAVWNGKDGRLKSATAIADCLALLDSIETTADKPVSTSVDSTAQVDSTGARTPLCVTTLIPPTLEHPGAGAMLVDHCFDSKWLEAMDSLYAQLPLVGSERARTCAVRSYHCDVDGFIADALQPVVECALQQQHEQYKQYEHGKSAGRCTVLPRCRFLTYLELGGDMQPHVDLSKQLDEYEPRCHAKSTHTFMIHLADCDQGGETVFLTHLNSIGSRQVDGRDKKPEPGLEPHQQNESYLEEMDRLQTVLGAAAPRRGRLVVFPHGCPHAGLSVLAVPKKFLRGELLLE